MRLRSLQPTIYRPSLARPELHPTLIETDRRSPKARVLAGGLIALAIHAVVIAGLVHAAGGAGIGHSAMQVDTSMVFLDAPRSQPPAVEPPALPAAPRGFQTVAIPAVVPAELPKVDLQEHFDPKDFTGKGVEGGRADGALADGSTVYTEAAVDELPQLVAAEPPPYPPLLKEAGIQGRVVVQAIVDTTGHAEPGSIRIVRSPSVGFERPVMEWVRRALFRPAKRDGRYVRVIVNLPVDYSITRGD